MPAPDTTLPSTDLTAEQHATLDRLRALADTDPIQLVKDASAEIARGWAEINERRLRDVRVSAALWLLRPWFKVTGEYDPKLDRLREPRKKALDAAAARYQRARDTSDRLLANGTITAGHHRARLAEATEARAQAERAARDAFKAKHGTDERQLLADRKAAMAKVPYEPKDVYEGILGVSRSTWTGWQEAATIATFPSDEDAMRLMLAAHSRILNLARYEDAIRGVRDPVMERMFTGQITDGGNRILNMHVAEWTGISQPAITQLRRRWGCPDEEASARNRMNRPEGERTAPPTPRTRAAAGARR